MSRCPVCSAVVTDPAVLRGININRIASAGARLVEAEAALSKMIDDHFARERWEQIRDDARAEIATAIAEVGAA